MFHVDVSCFKLGPSRLSEAVDSVDLHMYTNDRHSPSVSGIELVKEESMDAIGHHRTESGRRTPPPATPATLPRHQRD